MMNTHPLQKRRAAIRRQCSTDELQRPEPRHKCISCFHLAAGYLKGAVPHDEQWFLCMKFLRDVPNRDMFYQTRCPKYRRLLGDHLLQVVTLSPHPGRDGEYVVTPGSPWAPKVQGGGV